MYQSILSYAFVLTGPRTNSPWPEALPRSTAVPATSLTSAHEPPARRRRTHTRNVATRASRRPNPTVTRQHLPKPHIRPSRHRTTTGPLHPSMACTATAHIQFPRTCHPRLTRRHLSFQHPSVFDATNHSGKPREARRPPPCHPPSAVPPSYLSARLSFPWRPQPLHRLLGRPIDRRLYTVFTKEDPISHPRIPKELIPTDHFNIKINVADPVNHPNLSGIGRKFFSRSNHRSTLAVKSHTTKP